MSLDLVIVNYQTPDDLAACLRSLDLYPPETPASLTVVDVASTAREETFRWARGTGLTIGVTDNVGYARACNHAATRGHGDIIAFFNADVEFTPRTLDRCYQALINNRQWAVLGPCQVDTANRIRHAGIFGTMDAPVHRGWNEINRGQFADTREAVTVSGSAYFIHRSVWDLLTGCPLYRDVAPDAEGAFLPTSHYFEETWASYHARGHGYRVVYFGESTMIHKWHRASPMGGWAEQQMPTSQAYFRKACRHHGIIHD